eukprot:1192676-Prorocentrum_minimum.AAC.2
MTRFTRAVASLGGNGYCSCESELPIRIERTQPPGPPAPIFAPTPPAPPALHLSRCSDPIVRVYDLRMTPVHSSTGRRLESRVNEVAMFAPSGSVPPGAR